MIKWILALAFAFLAIDHLWIHYGPKVINYLAKGLSGKEVEAVEEREEERKSIIDTLVDKAKSLYKKPSQGSTQQ